MARRLDPSGWHVFHAGGAIVHAATAVLGGVASAAISLAFFPPQAYVRWVRRDRAAA